MAGVTVARVGLGGVALCALGDVGAGRDGAEERVAQLNVPAEQVDDVRQDARVVAQLKEQLVHRILAALLGRDGLLEAGDDGGQLLALRGRSGAGVSRERTLGDRPGGGRKSGLASGQQPAARWLLR